VGWPPVPTHHTLFIYAVYAQPLPTGPQNGRPFWGALEHGCRWAEGCSTASEVLTGTTVGLFQSGQFQYPSNTNASWVYGPTLSGFELTNLYNQLSRRVSGKCVDVSNYLCVVDRTLGLESMVLRVSDWNGKNFETNRVCLIGSDASSDNPYQPVTFDNHQV